MTTLLICGSRAATPAMLGYARRSVRRAIALHWDIIVGDAKGIDYCVVKQCENLLYPVECFGVTAAPRFSFMGVYQWVESTEHDQSWSAKYLYRDRWMVNRADCVLAIWNGQSRGTKYTYDYAVKCGRTAWLKQP